MKLKVVDVNVLHGGELYDNLIVFLRQENPDIICAQEIYNGNDKKLAKRFRSFKEIPKELGFSHNYFSPELKFHRKEGAMDIGNAIFSKFPIQNYSTQFYDGEYDPYFRQEDKNGDYSDIPKNLQFSAIKISNELILNVFNTHGVWGFDGEDNPKRTIMSDFIVSKIKNKENVVLCGDFNTLPHTNAMLAFEKYLKNVFKDELVSTFNMKQKTEGGFATSVVDYIFVSPNIKVLAHSCPQVDVSDHLPLVATLEI